MFHVIFYGRQGVGKTEAATLFREYLTRSGIPSVLVDEGQAAHFLAPVLIETRQCDCALWAAVVAVVQDRGCGHCYNEYGTQGPRALAHGIMKHIIPGWDGDD